MAIGGQRGGTELPGSTREDEDVTWIGSGLAIWPGSSVWVRDADRRGVVPVLSVPATAWRAFVAAVRAGRLS